ASTCRATSSPCRLNSRRNCVTSAAVRSSSLCTKARRVTSDTSHATAATDRKTVSADTTSILRRNIIVFLFLLGSGLAGRHGIVCMISHHPGAPLETRSPSSSSATCAATPEELASAQWRSEILATAHYLRSAGLP